MENLLRAIIIIIIMTATAMAEVSDKHSLAESELGPKGFIKIYGWL